MTRPISTTEAQRPVPALNTRSRVDGAFAYCENLARTHYENFPVASLLIPRELRRYVACIYAFARTADDLADEGSLAAADRLRKLDEWGWMLDECYAGKADHPVFIALSETVTRIGLPKKLFDDLLTAFRMDVTTSRFETFDDVLLYCRHSANPVGRIVLHLFDSTSPRLVLLSDAICTGLQLANFWQDVGRDWEKGRLYIPLEDCRRFGYTETDIGQRQHTAGFRRLMQFQVGRTWRFFEVGKPLLQEVVRPLRLELRLTWLGGTAILRKIEAAGYDVLTRRPVITAGDKLILLTRALLQRV